MTKIIDCRGQLCFQPLISTKKALKESVKSETTRVVIGITSCQNVSPFLVDNAIPFTVDESNDL